MIITWLGHSCFRIEIKEGSILIDPFSKEIGLKPPRLKDNIIVVSHDHYDHNNTDGAGEGSFIINSPGEYEKHGVYLRGIPSFHDNKGGTERGLNSIFVIKAEDVAICHMGDFGEDKLSDSQVSEIGNIDILMIPVGGKYTIGYKEAVAVIGQIGPKIVIPMHYKVKDLKLDIEGPDKFVKESGITPEKVDKFKIAKKSLPVEEVKLILFQ